MIQLSDGTPTDNYNKAIALLCFLLVKLYKIIIVIIAMKPLHFFGKLDYSSNYILYEFI